MATTAPRAYKGVAKLIVYAGSGKPNPKMGQALGPLGLNMMSFCKDFNEKTQKLRNDIPLRVVLKAYTDRTYNYVVKPPPTSWFLKRCAMVSIGTNYPKKRNVGVIGIKYVYEIAKIKKSMDPHLRGHNVIGLCKMIMAQAENMGILIVDETLPPEPTIPKKI
jgi:large subunit ribosomal protein L11